MRIENVLAIFLWLSVENLWISGWSSKEKLCFSTKKNNTLIIHPLYECDSTGITCCERIIKTGSTHPLKKTIEGWKKTTTQRNSLCLALIIKKTKSFVPWTSILTSWTGRMSSESSSTDIRWVIVAPLWPGYSFDPKVCAHFQCPAQWKRIILLKWQRMSRWSSCFNHLLLWVDKNGENLAKLVEFNRRLELTYFQSSNSWQPIRPPSQDVFSSLN